MRRLLLVTLIFFIAASQAAGYKILYAEQYYKMYRRNLYMYPEDLKENIVILEHALSSDFVNPLNALSRQITNDTEWERYRYLFAMHVNLEIVKQYRLLGAGYDKRRAYFFNAPFKEITLKSLRYAESYYETALYYWERALEWSQKAWELRFIDLTDIASWQDDNWRIEHGELDYYEYIQDDLERVRQVRAELEAMDEDTY